MAFSSLSDYTTSLISPNQFIPFTLGASTTIAGRAYSGWLANLPSAGAAPTTAAVPSRTIAGALGQANADTERLMLSAARFSSTAAGFYILCDRLSHQGGLSGNVTTSQTTNLPTAALTRYTGGAEVCMALEIYTQIGTTASTVSVTYTNEAGTGSRVTPACVIGGTGFREVRRMICPPLVAGDLGVRSVESVIINTTATGTVGAFGVTLFRPLYGFHIDRVGAQVTFNLLDGGMTGGLPEILDDACLFWMFIPDRTSTTVMGTLNLTTKQ